MSRGRRRQSFSGRFKELQERYASQLQTTVDEIEEAARVCLFSDASNKPWRKLRASLHDVAGSAAAFGFATVTRTARALEELVVCSIGKGGALEQGQQQQAGVLLEVLRQGAEGPDDDLLSKINNAWATSEGAAADEATEQLVVLAGLEESQAQTCADGLAHLGYDTEVVETIAELGSLEYAATSVSLVVNLDLVDDAATAVVSDLRRQLAGRVLTIAAASTGELGDRLTALSLGADEFMHLPLDLLGLIDALQRRRQSQELEPPRILIIDNSQALANYYSLVLEQAGMTTKVLNDPQLTIEALYDFRPNLILMDLYMPRCSGLELAAVIRQVDAFVTVPLVFLSSEQDVTKQLRALSVGGDDFLTKPVLPEHLVGAVLTRAERARTLSVLIQTDTLTGLANHEHTMRALEVEVARAARRGATLAWCLLDIDHLKRINQQHGYAGGDRLLKCLARMLKQRLRRTDVIGRLGGGEIACILLDIDSTDAVSVIDGIRQGFRDFPHAISELEASISCGIAQFPSSGSLLALCDAAENALARAKSLGRNRVVVAEG